MSPVPRELRQGQRGAAPAQGTGYRAHADHFRVAAGSAIEEEWKV